MIENATSWGAALGAAAEFRDDCLREIERRKYNSIIKGDR